MATPPRARRRPAQTTPAEPRAAAPPRPPAADDAPTIPLPEAMRRLRLSRSSVERLMDAGLFTVLAPRGRGAGKRVYLRTDEVMLYAMTRDERAVRDFRAKEARR